MIRPPPRSPLFPYPTLSRSQRTRSSQPSGRSGRGRRSSDRRSTRETHSQRDMSSSTTVSARGSRTSRLPRSEEHTSELQSRQYLVCRLLLEKKKKNETSNH